MEIQNKYAPMIYRDGEFTKKDLKPGYFYATNNNRILMYLGLDKHNDYVFYKMCGYLFDNPEYFIRNGDKINLAHHNIQVSSIVQMINDIMDQNIDANCFVKYRNVPRIVSDFMYINKEKEVEEWYNKNKTEDSPQIDFTNIKKTSEYVSVKDLIPGKLYYTGPLWRSLYCYLGRDSANNFCWSFIGNEDYLVNETTTALLSGFEKTKNNKKVYPIEHALNDPRAYIYDDVKQFLDGHFCADVSNINLDNGTINHCKVDNDIENEYE